MPECLHTYFFKDGKFLPTEAFVQDALEQGYSVYEVIRVDNSCFLFWEDHIDRLYRSVELSGLHYQLKPEKWNQIFQELMQKNKQKEGNVKILLRQTSEMLRRNLQLLVYFIPHKYPTLDDYQHGVNASILELERFEPNIKKQHHKNFRLYAKAIAERKVYEILLVNSKGHVTESSRSNVFFIQGKRLITAPVNEVLTGVTRKYTLLAATGLDIQIEERSIAKEELNAFDAAFITGTSPKLLALHSIDNLHFQIGHPVYLHLLQSYNHLIERYCANAK